MYQKYENVRKLALMILQESGQNVFDDKEKTPLAYSLISHGCGRSLSLSSC